MYYLNKIVGFAISPIGIAVFGGLLVLLCARLKLPRLAKCPPSHFGKTGLTYFPTSSASSMASLGMSSPAANGATSPTSGERSYQRSDNLGLTYIIT